MGNDTNKITSNKVLNIIGIVLCVILVPILIVNCTLIIKSLINKEEVPDFAGVLPMIVLSPSMEPDIKEGDLIICVKVDADEVKEGDVISFFDPSGNGSMVTTHKVNSIETKNGKKYFNTYGINNFNSDGEIAYDPKPVPADDLVGRYTGVRLPAVGNVAMFMQTTAGLIICVIVPIVLLVGYDILRRKLYDKKSTEDVDALRAELEALRAMQEKTQNAESGIQKTEEKDEERSD